MKPVSHSNRHNWTQREEATLEAALLCVQRIDGRVILDSVRRGHEVLVAEGASKRVIESFSARVRNARGGA